MTVHVKVHILFQVQLPLGVNLKFRDNAQVKGRFNSRSSCTLKFKQRFQLQLKYSKLRFKCNFKLMLKLKSRFMCILKSNLKFKFRLSLFKLRSRLKFKFKHKGDVQVHVEVRLSQVREIRTHVIRMKGGSRKTQTTTQQRRKRHECLWFSCGTFRSHLLYHHHLHTTSHAHAQHLLLDHATDNVLRACHFTSQVELDVICCVFHQIGHHRILAATPSFSPRCPTISQT